MKRAAIIAAVLVAVAVAVGLARILPAGDTHLRRNGPRPDRTSWCAIARFTNGTGMIATYHNVSADLVADVFSARGAYANAAPTAIRPDVLALLASVRHDHPDIRAAQAVDAYVATYCS